MSKQVTGTGVIGFFAVIGSLFTIGNGGVGFLYGAAIGATVWLLSGALINQSRAQVIAVVTIVGGAWIGWAFGGDDGILYGALWGSAVFVGWVVSRLIWGAHVEPLDEDDTDPDLDTPEMVDARWHYENDPAYRAEVDDLFETDPVAAWELSGGLV